MKKEDAVTSKNIATMSLKDQFRQAGQAKNLVKIAVLGGLGFMIMQLFRVPLPFAPSFMTVDFGDVPALVGGFSMGPVAGMLIQLIKNILKLFTTDTVGVGELSNFIVGSVFVIVSAAYYKRHRSKKGALIATILGSVAMTTVALLSNAFFIFPAYAKAIDMDLDQLALSLGEVNSLISNYWTLMIFAVVPFNLVKGALQSVVTWLLYKRISPILHK